MGSSRLGRTPTKPLVSAVIPTYNRARCLPRAIESILAQEGLGEGFEIETIVVDDGSTDATPDIVRRYAELRYIRLPSRRGVSAALNEGVRASTGCFITFLGDDDQWLPHKLRTQVPLLSSHPEMGIVYGQYVVRRRGREELYPTIGRARSGWVFFDMLLDGFCSHHAALLARRTAVEEAGEFDESLTTCEDFDLSLRIARRYPFLFAPGAVTVYNLSSHGSWLTRVASGAGAQDAERVIEKALRTLPDSHQYGAVKQAARARAALVTVSSLALLGDPARARERLLATLRIHPWAIRHEWARRYVKVLATERVLSGEPPVAVVRDLYVPVRAVTRPDHVSLRWWGQLLAHLELRRLGARLSRAR